MPGISIADNIRFALRQQYSSVRTTVRGSLAKMLLNEPSFFLPPTYRFENFDDSFEKNVDGLVPALSAEVSCEEAGAP